MSRVITLLILNFIILNPYSFAEIKEFTLADQNQTKVKTFVPKNWDTFTNLLNTPLTLLSKKGAQDTATVIQVIPYGIKDDKDLFSKMEKDTENYYSSKEEQLEASDGEVISYEPLEQSKKDGVSVHSIGIKYKNDMGEFLDQSYFITSKSKELFFVKTLIPLDQEKEHISLVKEVIDSISTKN